MSLATHTRTHTERRFGVFHCLATCHIDVTVVVVAVIVIVSTLPVVIASLQCVFFAVLLCEPIKIRLHTTEILENPINRHIQQRAACKAIGRMLDDFTVFVCVCAYANSENPPEERTTTTTHTANKNDSGAAHAYSAREMWPDCIS